MLLLASCLIAPAQATSTDLLCTRADGAGSFHFVINYGRNQVDVGRYKAIPARIDDKSIKFKYYLGQLWGKTDTPAYEVTFDRASGSFMSHTPAGADSSGKRWGEGDAGSACK